MNEPTFLRNDYVKEIMKKQRSFLFDIKFTKQYENEIILFMTLKGKNGSFFLIKWDDLDISVYHESFRGVLDLSNRVITVDSSSNLYKLFIEKARGIVPSFFLQTSIEEMKYYQNEFIVFKRRQGSLDWGLCAFNGREFKEGSDYPDTGYESLVDFILLEFGWMP